MTKSRTRKSAVQHYLLSARIAADVHLHCYLMTADKRQATAAAGRLLDEAEKLGASHPLMAMILMTPLAPLADGIEAVRAIVSSRSAEARRMLAQAADFHMSLFATRVGDAEDLRLMGLH